MNPKIIDITQTEDQFVYHLDNTSGTYDVYYSYDYYRRNGNKIEIDANTIPLNMQILDTTSLPVPSNEIEIQWFHSGSADAVKIEIYFGVEKIESDLIPTPDTGYYFYQFSGNQTGIYNVYITPMTDELVNTPYYLISQKIYIRPRPLHPKYKVDYKKSAKTIKVGSI